MNSDPLKSALQNEAAENAPAFSPLVHERMMANLRAADPAVAIPAPLRHRWLRPSAAAAAILVAGAFIAFHMRTGNTITPHPAPLAQFPSTSDLTAPVDKILAEATLPVEQTFDQGKYAYFDQDVKRLAVFLADQIPSPPAGMTRNP